MKRKFEWYLPISDSEMESIWKEKGILTLDTNVLLDLYRYHDSTRNALLDNLITFKGRIWLAHQVADEFFKNRANVIISSAKKFSEAEEKIDELALSLKSISEALKGNRIIPKVSDKMRDKIDKILKEAKEEIVRAKNGYPEYLKSDPVLEKLLSLFSESIGNDFLEENIQDIKDEAKRRISTLVPPGYKDKNKDGEQSYGDYFLWKQMLDYSKEKNSPIIFVTSERKEDWWEVISGKTVGPRNELKKEAFEKTGQRILFYQTDNFLETASKFSGKKVDSKIVEEVREINSIRTQQAVQITEHSIYHSDANHQSGYVIVYLARQVKNLTCTCDFDCQMSRIPKVNMNVIASPNDTPEITLRAGSGNSRQFNLHIIATNNSKLPIGKYTLEYNALVEDDD